MSTSWMKSGDLASRPSLGESTMVPSEGAAGHLRPGRAASAERVGMAVPGAQPGFRASSTHGVEWVQQVHPTPPHSPHPPHPGSKR